MRIVSVVCTEAVAIEATYLVEKKKASRREARKGSSRTGAIEAGVAAWLDYVVP